MKALKVILVLSLISLSFLAIRGIVHPVTGNSNLPLEGNPRCIAIHSFTDQAIVASARPHEVYVIDLNNRWILSTIPVGRSPLGVAIDEELNLALVSSRQDRTLFVIDLNTYRVLSRIQVGKSPEGVAVHQDSHMVLVANKGDDTVSVIDLNNGQNRLIKTIPVGKKPKDVAIDPTLNLALVVNEGGGNVSVIDLTTYRVTGHVQVGRKPGAISINPKTHLAVVANETDHSITIIDLQNYQTRSIPVGRCPIDLAINPLDNSVVVICERDHRLLHINLDTYTIIGQYDINRFSRGVAVNPFTNIAALVDDRTDSLTLIQLPNPIPQITSIAPKTILRGSKATKVMIVGAGFIKHSAVSTLPVTFIDNDHLEVEVPEGLLATAGTYGIRVTNPAPNGGASNLVSLSINNPVPSLVALAPAGAFAGTQGLILTVYGTGFFNDTIVSINGRPRGFTLIDRTRIQIQLTHEDMEAGRYLDITAFNHPPGGGASNALMFTVQNPLPVLSSVTPSSAIAGSPEFTLTLNGDNFVKTSIVSFNGQSVVSTYISKTQLQATVPATAVTTPGSYSVKVTHPTPGGGESAPLIFIVKPAALLPEITGFSPSEGPVGTIVTINGNNFDVSGLRVSFNGTPAIVSSFTKASITTSVPMGAATGPIIVTTNVGSATSTTNFTVTSRTDFNLSITPQNAKAAPQSEVSYIVSATGTEGFSNLVTLSIQGLSDGFSAYFSPKTITSGQSSTLTISTCDCTLRSPATLTITGTANIEGRTVARSVNVSLEMIAQGVTALTGRVLNTDKLPIKGVTIRVGDSSTTTDESGNFLLKNPPTGEKVVLIDGSPASTDTAKYPTIPITMNIIAGQTNSLPFIPHFHAQKNYNFTPINPYGETILEDPEIPGFQMRIPAGVNIIGWDGQPNVKVSVRRVPIDALPVPPPPPDVEGRTVYMFYFDKVGGGVPDVPIPVTVPNDLGLPPGEKADLWYFNESPNINEAPNEWEIAGTGTVSEDGNTISTDPGVGIPRFCCGAILWAPRQAMGPNLPPAEDRCKIGNFSVEPSTGVFMHSKTDLNLPDRIPINVVRHYRTLDHYNGPYGPGTYFGYDWYLFLYGGMATLVTPPGTRVSFYRQPDGTYINTSEPMYRGAVLTFNPYGRLRMKDGMTYRFDGNGLLIEQEDRNGNRLRFVRGRYTDIDRIIGTDGRVLVTFRIRISHRDHIIEMTDIQGRKVTYNYGIGGRLVSVTDVNGGVTRYTYDSQGRMASIIDPRGNTVLTVSYDVNGRVCQEQYADEGSHKFYYITVDQASTPGAFKLLKEAEAGGPITAPLCSAVASKSPVAYTIVVDPSGKPTIYRFNSAQKIISSTNADGQTAVINRDPVTNLVNSRIDSLGRATSYTYDHKGNITSMTDPAGNTTRYEYEPMYNLLTKVTDPLSHVTRYEYDSRGHMTKIINPLGQETVMAYDQYGQITSLRDSSGNTTRFEYDSSGNLTATIDPLGNRVAQTYDAIFRLTSMTSASGRTTTYKYNNLNKVIEITDSMNNVTKFDHDANGNLTRVTDAKNQSISHVYDADNRLIRMTDQLGNFETYEYDFNGNIIRKRDRKGHLTTYSYDDRNRLKRVDYADGSYTENIYDALGRLIRIDDSISGPIQYVYSDTGCSTCGGVPDKVIQEITPLGSISYTYDALGRRTSMTVAGQATVNYQYDLNSRLLGISTLNPQLGNLNFNFSYDSLGRRTSLIYPNGIATNYQYDSASNLLELKHLNPLNQILESINYTYDANGSRTNMQRANVPVKLPDPKTNITFNSTNQMLTFNDKSMTYDENGNLISVLNPCGTTSYTWDARNRLIAINGFASALTSASTCEALSASFKYDALGRRIERSINGRTIQYLYDGQDIVQGIEGGQVAVNYIRTLNVDEPLARVESSGVVRYYQQDALGSVIALADETGNIKTQYVYDPFGNTNISGEASDNPFQYTGRENDLSAVAQAGGTGLYYYRARYYSPELQRFVSEDPIKFEGGDVNFYAYVGNNPVNWIDPLGLKCKKGFWQRSWENFKTTNEVIPGVLAPPFMGALTGGKMAEALGSITIRQWVAGGFRGAVLSGVTFTGLATGIIAVGTAAVNAAYVALALETGVAIGSIISAAILPCEEEPPPPCQ